LIRDGPKLTWCASNSRWKGLLVSTRKPLSIDQSEKYEGDKWWKWAVWLSGSDDELDGVAQVEYTLHPSFPTPVRVIATRKNQFKLSSQGWGVFPIYARVLMKDGTVLRLRHQLQLHYPDGKRNTD
jgi:transcription initiation factor IIF auxiliary subunit